MVSSMAIENVIQRSCINLHMKGRNKKEIIEEMAGMFDKAGVLASRQMFIQAVYERESEGPTGIGNQVAIPHGKSDAVIKTAMAVGRVDRGWIGRPLGKERPGHLSCSRSTVRTNQSWFHYCPRWQLHYVTMR